MTESGHPSIEFRYDPETGRLYFNRIGAKDGTGSQWREITPQDRDIFRQWLTRYEEIVKAPGSGSQLLALGSDIYQWLDYSQRWITRLCREVPYHPLVVHFAVSRKPGEEELRFLEVPWELLAGIDGFLAADSRLLFCPVRRLGPAGLPETPSPFRLHTVFMAASPMGLPPLDFEREEAAILEATLKNGMDLTVEESGNLGPLSDLLAEESRLRGGSPPGVLHLSCYGAHEPGDGSAALVLETHDGRPHLAAPVELAGAVTLYPPRLLFLSAAETPPSHLNLSSYSASLVTLGIPAVLSWSGPLSETEALHFSTRFYGLFSRGQPLAHAVARARWELPGKGEQRFDGPGGSQTWHRVRLYLGPGGGGALSRGNRPPARRHPEYSSITFLEVRDRMAPVAGHREFVGRRRELQRISREFRQPEYGGILLHGMGRQGKSSLAARAAGRMTHHNLVVVFGRYGARDILEALLRGPAGTEDVRKLVAPRLDEADRDPAALLSLWKQLLMGPLAQIEPPMKDDFEGRFPVLLVLDDFDRALDAPDGNGLFRLKPQLADSTAALLEAFALCLPETQSRLLITCRFRFTLETGGRDLAAGLMNLHLPPMTPAESRKQAGALARIPGKENAWKEPGREERLKQCMAAGRGNPGLQNLLFHLELHAPDTCGRAMEEMQAFLEKGKEPGEENILNFVRSLALDRLPGLLTPAEKELLRASTLFTLPAPPAVIEALARELGLETGDPVGRRLSALGLWEPFDDPLNPGTPAIAINELARSRAGKLNEAETAELAAIAVGPLLEYWGGEDEDKYPDRMDAGPARLALLAGNTEKALELLEKIRSYFKSCGRHVDEAVTMGKIARILTGKGQLDTALVMHRERLKVYEAHGDRRAAAVTIGDIARILRDKGELDTALTMHREKLNIMEALGDRRSIAVSMGDIANILLLKGEPGEAVKLQRERLDILMKLGDLSERATALWDLAQIELHLQNTAKALAYLTDAYELFLKTGRLEGIALIGLYLGPILCRDNRKKQGLAILRRSLEGFRKLGMTDSAKEAESIIATYVGRKEKPPGKIPKHKK